MARISVTPADEDEVIIAGVGSEDDPEPESSSAPNLGAGGAAETVAGSEAISPAGHEGAHEKADYPDVTLEDLETPSMPLAQRIVIVAAVVCIIGAIVAYLAVMR